ncbi:unnamed protein product [Amoebophrya sp. A25]|nr:unnamed protein product [Amoebophrya sp. A25]|eukprot:GSA25T00014429001.1
MLIHLFATVVVVYQEGASFWCGILLAAAGILVFEEMKSKTTRKTIVEVEQEEDEDDSGGTHLQEQAASSSEIALFVLCIAGTAPSEDAFWLSSFAQGITVALLVPSMWNGHRHGALENRREHDNIRGWRSHLYLLWLLPAIVFGKFLSTLIALDAQARFPFSALRTFFLISQAVFLLLRTRKGDCAPPSLQKNAEGHYAHQRNPLEEFLSFDADMDKDAVEWSEISPIHALLDEDSSSGSNTSGNSCCGRPQTPENYKQMRDGLKMVVTTPSLSTTSNSNTSTSTALTFSTTKKKISSPAPALPKLEVKYRNGLVHIRDAVQVVHLPDHDPDEDEVNKSPYVVEEQDEISTHDGSQMEDLESVDTNNVGAPPVDVDLDDFLYNEESASSDEDVGGRDETEESRPLQHRVLEAESSNAGARGAIEAFPHRFRAETTSVANAVETFTIGLAFIVLGLLEGVPMHGNVNVATSGVELCSVLFLVPMAIQIMLRRKLAAGGGSVALQGEAAAEVFMKDENQVDRDLLGFRVNAAILLRCVFVSSLVIACCVLKIFAVLDQNNASSLLIVAIGCITAFSKVVLLFYQVVLEGEEVVILLPKSVSERRNYHLCATYHVALLWCAGQLIGSTCYSSQLVSLLVLK